MKIKPVKALAFVCLSALVTGPVATSADAAEVSAKPAVTKPASGRQVAKIVVVDKAAKTVTVELNGKLYLLNTGSQLKLTENGKAIGIDNLAPGQDVSVTMLPTVTGGSQIASVNLEPSATNSEAAAARKKRRKGSNPGSSMGTQASHGEWGSSVSPNR